jgi:hypothetical protein
MVSADSTWPPGELIDIDRSVGIPIGEQQQPRTDISRQTVVNVAEDQNLPGPEKLRFDPADEVA